MKQKITFHVVASSHWDREWYLPQKRFQFRLVRLLEKVWKLQEEKEEYHFLLDGQTIPVKDYLQIRPDRESLLKKKIRENAVTVGPWYVVPDMAIVSGESLVRNLEIGKEIMEEFQGVNSVGYCPDTFGLVSQTPQLFSQFGYSFAQFTRGQRAEDGKAHLETLWISPDGTGLPTLYDAYASGLFLSYQEFRKNMQRHYPDNMASVRVIRELIAKRRQDDSLSSHHLLIVGIDHAEPRENLLEVMEFLRREIPEAEFLYSTQQAYFEAMAAEMSGRLPISSGEQRGPYEEHFFLSNTLSSRVDLKMKNRQLENSLQMYGEPMNALVPVGKDFEDFAVDGFLDQAWRLMVENHSHDAICTCSVDPVLHDIENRMDNAGYWAGDVKEHLLRKMARRVTPVGENTPVLLLWNPLPWKRDAFIQTMVRVPYDLPEHFHLEDADGNIVPAALEVVGKKRIDIETEKMWDEDILRDEIGGPVSLPPEPTDIFTFVRVKLRAKELPPMGYAAYYFLPGEGEALPVSDLMVTENGMENSLVRVQIEENGSLTVEDKKTGRIMRRLCYFEDDGDHGDSYTFSPAGQTFSSLSLKAQKQVLEQDGAHIVCQITLPFLLPERMDHVRKERVRELRSLPLQVKIELRREDPVVYVEVKLNNCVRDHRLRWVFAHSSKARSSISDSAFDLVERPALTDPRPEQINTQPMRNLLTVPYEDQACLTVYSASSQEYEVYNRHREGYAALTLLRSVEAVNRSDLLTKDDTAVGIGVGWWTESNEMQQELVLPLAFRIDAPSDSRNDWMKQAQLYQYPVEAISELAEGDQPAVCSGISLSGEGVLSMVRRPFRKEYTEIRLFNLEGKETQAALHLSWPVKKAEYVSLSGEEMGVCANDTENIAVTLPAHKIVTVRLWP